jgi:hypothetical protein
MISVSRDGKPIMICEGAQGQPGTWLWVGVEDAEALFSEFSAKGARVRSPPQNFDWAYEFQIEDPDGHVLRFGSESKPGPKGGVFKIVTDWERKSLYRGPLLRLLIRGFGRILL